MAVMEMPTVSVGHDNGAEPDKSPYNRLLDMMAGWGRYVDNDEEDGFADAPGVNEKIHELYQDAGSLQVSKANPHGTEAEEAIRVFVMTKVLPALLHKG